MEAKNKVIAVVGATGSGKSGLAHALAYEFSGELVSADSRQLYRGFDIGSAKDPGKWVSGAHGPLYMVDGVPEHMVDILHPDEELSVAQYKERAEVVIDSVISRGKVPFLVGGTGLYVDAVLDNLQFPDVAPNTEVRKRLETKSLEDLQATYANCDPAGALSIDQNNRRRLVRAIEVCWVSGRPFSEQQTKGEQRYDALKLAIDLPREQLYMRIDVRVDQMLKAGLVREVNRLLDEGVDIRSNAMTGIGYKEVVNYIQGDTNFEDMRALIKRNTRRLAKRQLSWFRRDARIRWVRTQTEAFERVQEHLESKKTA